MRGRSHQHKQCRNRNRFTHHFLLDRSHTVGSQARQRQRTLEQVPFLHDSQYCLPSSPTQVLQSLPSGCRIQPVQLGAALAGSDIADNAAVTATTNNKLLIIPSPCAAPDPRFRRLQALSMFASIRTPSRGDGPGQDDRTQSRPRQSAVNPASGCRPSRSRPPTWPCRPSSAPSSPPACSRACPCRGAATSPARRAAAAPR